MRNQIRNIAWTTLLAALFLSPQDTQGQYALDYGFAFGTGNYLGDIGGDALERRDLFPDLHLSQTKLSTHVFVRQRLNGALAVRAQLGTTFIEDYDNLSTNPARMTRNAHFRNFIHELSLRSEVNIFSRTSITKYSSKFRVGINTYGILGVTGFVHNPQARLDATSAQYHLDQGNISELVSAWDYDKWYNLRAAGTEKQDYGIASLGVPMGVGASFIVNYNTRIGIEFVWNTTFTDHLDDVSGTYADPESFVGDASQGLSRDMQYVLSQPANSTVATAAGVDNPEAYLNSFRWDAAYESPRGNPDKNDSYGTLQVTVSKVVKNSSAFFKSNNYTARRAAKRRAYRGKPDNSNRVFGRPKV